MKNVADNKKIGSSNVGVDQSKKYHKYGKNQKHERKNEYDAEILLTNKNVFSYLVFVLFSVITTLLLVEHEKFEYTTLVFLLTVILFINRVVIEKFINKSDSKYFYISSVLIAASSLFTLDADLLFYMILFCLFILLYDFYLLSNKFEFTYKIFALIYSIAAPIFFLYKILAKKLNDVLALIIYLLILFSLGFALINIKGEAIPYAIGVYILLCYTSFYPLIEFDRVLILKEKQNKSTLYTTIKYLSIVVSLITLGLTSMALFTWYFFFVKMFPPIVNVFILFEHPGFSSLVITSLWVYLGIIILCGLLLIKIPFNKVKYIFINCSTFFIVLFAVLSSLNALSNPYFNDFVKQRSYNEKLLYIKKHVNNYDGSFQNLTALKYIINLKISLKNKCELIKKYPKRNSAIKSYDGRKPKYNLKINKFVYPTYSERVKINKTLMDCFGQGNYEYSNSNLNP